MLLKLSLKNTKQVDQQYQQQLTVSHAGEQVAMAKGRANGALDTLEDLEKKVQRTHRLFEILKTQLLSEMLALLQCNSNLVFPSACRNFFVFANHIHSSGFFYVVIMHSNLDIFDWLQVQQIVFKQQEQQSFILKSCDDIMTWTAAASTT